MTTVKVFKAGNSLAVTVPRELALRLNIREGDRVLPEVERSKISYRTLKKGSASVSPEFKRWLRAFEKKYDRALEELAKR